MPVIAGLGTDIAGARASIALAERLRGAYDHLQSDRIFADLDVLRQAGRMFTTPNEARLRADVLLFVGKDLTRVWPQLLQRLAPAESPEFDLAHAARRLVWIAPGRAAAQVDGLSVTTLELHGFACHPRELARAPRRSADQFGKGPQAQA